MTKEDKIAQDYRKKQFLEELRLAHGNETKACKQAGIIYTKVEEWMSDDDFRRTVEHIENKEQQDYVLEKLFQRIADGDTTAIIFYCKTRLKDQGYTDKPATREDAERMLRIDPGGQKKLDKKLKAKKDYIIKMLKAQGIYSSELSMQVTITAGLLVKTEELAAIVMADGHNPISVELSREGNERQSVNVYDRLFLEYSQQAQKSLKALGMNTDAKNKVIEASGMSDFFKGGDDD